MVDCNTKGLYVQGIYSFEFYDKGAIRGIKPSFTEESGTDSNGYYIKDDNGYITIKKITFLMV